MVPSAPAYAVRKDPVSGFVDVVHLAIDDHTASKLGLSFGLDIRLTISADYLESLDAWTRADTHRVVLERSSPTHTTATLLGVDATPRIVESVPYGADLRRRNVILAETDSYDLDDHLGMMRFEAAEPAHFFLGFPDPVQLDVWADAESDVDRIARQGRSMPSIRDYRLLFQLDSDMDRGLLFGDPGRIYVLIPSSGLATLDTSATVILADSS